MGLFSLFKNSPRKPLIPIERSLDNINLVSNVKHLENDTDWFELTGSEKSIFDSGLENERLFTSESEISYMCGFLFDKLYKIALMVPAQQGKSFIEKFSEKYGKPIKLKKSFLRWEDDNTTLEVSIRGSQSNIMLTDKQLLLKAHSLK